MEKYFLCMNGKRWDIALSWPRFIYYLSYRSDGTVLLLQRGLQAPVKSLGYTATVCHNESLMLTCAPLLCYVLLLPPFPSQSPSWLLPPSWAVLTDLVPPEN